MRVIIAPPGWERAELLLARFALYLYCGYTEIVIEFDWDEDNIEHLAEHRVTPADFEQGMTLDPFDLDHSFINGEDRFHTVGMTSVGRILFMAWTTRGDKIRAVTAFDSPRGPRKEWEGRLQ